MRLSFVFLQLLSIINTLRGVSGEPEKASDNLHIKFEKHIEFEDDWEDDFYQHFNRNKSSKDDQKDQQDQLWIDWSDVEDEEFAEALDVDIDEISAEAEADSETQDDQLSEADSFITARDQHEATQEDSEEGALNFDDEYTFIEGISDSDSEASELDIHDDEFYNEAMGDIADCFDTDDDLSSEEVETPTSIIQDKLETGATGGTAEVPLKKWESLSEENWSEFEDEKAVFDFIATAISESIFKKEDAVDT